MEVQLALTAPFLGRFRMGKRQPYWLTDRPSDAKRWQGCEFGAVLSNDEYRDRLFRLYRRYAKQWNDIELDGSRSLSEHTHQVRDAKVVGASNSFIMHGRSSRDENWILEVRFARGFKKYYPGMSTGLNALRSPDDIGRITLHWSARGKDSFEEWLAHEQAENSGNGEWSIYQA